ncbi:DNA primase small subunit [Aplysia californica]|uniref:DNA primase n=1 Tax=Aplysia californica TaxID=6500 RepID=A0ABM0KAC5_APLCA|nr:DNA primase small subunit [Aplysia californica]XP_005112754.1 DNA primase small subunit [Aplysia californica]
MAAQSYDPNVLPDLLPLYYKRLFPYGPYYRWLNYGGVPKNYFTHREFSFTLKDDVYVRYQSFADQQDLEKELQKKCPHKIDIGAVYSHRPKDHKTVKSTAFQAQEKELVFDIDMTDYDDVRSCCSGADICSNCWPLMVIAVKILDRALRDDFGFEHLLWVYSGRRGIHCWVCDENARKLSAQGRSAIAEYLTLVKGGDSQVRKVNLPDRLHPSVRHAVNVINSHFVDYAFKKQDLLDCEEKWKGVLAVVPSEVVRDCLSRDFVKHGKDTASRWTILKRRLTEGKQESMLKPYVEEEIKLQFCYPRLDVNVSKGVNHLLKSPFCIHPKTGRVCVPMDPKTIDDFDPMDVPTISGLLDELDHVEVGTKDEQGKRVRDYKKTSLGPYLETFESFLKDLEGSRKGKLIEQSDIKMEF